MRHFGVSPSDPDPLPPDDPESAPGGAEAQSQEGAATPGLGEAGTERRDSMKHRDDVGPSDPDPQG